MNRRLSIVLLLAFLAACVPESGRRTPVVPPTPEPEPQPDPDPITEVETPGAYGVEGGTLLFDTGRLQISQLRYGNSLSIRLLDPEALSVVSLSGLPSAFKAGDKCSFLYRVSRNGIIVAVSAYKDVEVLKVEDGKAWLKQDEQTYFVLEL